MKKYLVQCWFSYGWDDAGWYLDEKPHRFNSITEAEDAIDEFIRDTTAEFHKGNLDSYYYRPDFRAVEDNE